MKFFLVFAAIGLLILAFILASIDLQKTFDILSKANLWLVGLSVAAAGISITLKSLKWKVLIGIYDKTHSLKRCMKAWLVGFAVGIATPGRIGDFSRAYYTKERMGMGKSLVTVLTDRLVDIAILFCLTIAGMLSFLTILANQSSMLATTVIFFSIFLLGIYVFSRKSALKAVMKPLCRRVVPARYKQRFNVAAGDFMNGIDTMKSRKRVVAGSALIGIAAWFFSILQFYFLAAALGINASYVFLLSVMPIVVLFDTLPVSIAGIGTRDALLVLFFGAIALSKEQAISFSFMVLIFGYLLIGAAGAVILLGEGRKITL
jgi:uncharacterized protein (TIRG00374 family)